MADIFERLMLVCDMDGTLLNRQSQVSPENQRALREFVAAGGRFTVATGRSERAVKPYLADLPVNAPAILCNGAVIHDFETSCNLLEVYLAAEIRGTVAAILERFPEVAVQVHQRDQAYFLRHNEMTMAFAEQLSPGSVPEQFIMDQLPEPWLKVLLIGKPEQLADAEAFLKSDPVPFCMVYSEPHYLELLPEGVSKGRALQNLLLKPEYAGLKTVAMGDNPNDLELIALADLGIAVGNAHPDLKKLAKFCSSDHDAHAVAEVIERLRRLLLNGYSKDEVLKRMDR